MKKIFRKIKNIFAPDQSSYEVGVLTRPMLEKKVDQGTARAVKEYGEVFRKLAEYDRK